MDLTLLDLHHSSTLVARSLVHLSSLLPFDCEMLADFSLDCIFRLRWLKVYTCRTGLGSQRCKITSVPDSDWAATTKLSNDEDHMNMEGQQLSVENILSLHHSFQYHLVCPWSLYQTKSGNSSLTVGTMESEMVKLHDTFQKIPMVLVICNILPSAFMYGNKLLWVRHNVIRGLLPWPLVFSILIG